MHRTTESVEQMHPHERQVTIETDSTHAADAAKPPPTGKHHNKHSSLLQHYLHKMLAQIY